MNEALIYVTEWTHPQDGTKRRPIVERVPECRPKLPPTNNNPAGCELVYIAGQDRWCWWYGKASGDGGKALDTDPFSAAALLRCAVWKYLSTNRKFADEQEGLLGDLVATALLNGPDDARLVQAAHLVADAKGVEH